MPYLIVTGEKEGPCFMGFRFDGNIADDKKKPYFMENDH
jgi:hypothetical protein